MNRLQTTLVKRSEAQPTLAIGKCADCGELYGWPGYGRGRWKLNQLYSGIHCPRCGSELELKRTTWGKRRAVLLLPAVPA